MSISHRKFRATIFDYEDAGTNGELDSTYELVTSGDGDDAWWASRGQPTGRETTIGMKADHRVDAELGFSAVVPVTEDGAVVVDGVEYLVRAILARDNGRDEVQVLVERTPVPLSLRRYTSMAVDETTVSATAPEGGPDPADEAVIVSRTGTGSVTLAGPAAAIAYGQVQTGWLSVVRSGADPAYTFTLSFTVGALVAGVYTATVTITDANAPHTPLTVAVTFTVT